MEITGSNYVIRRKNEQISLLESKIADSVTSSSHKTEEVEKSQVSASTFHMCVIIFYFSLKLISCAVFLRARSTVKWEIVWAWGIHLARYFYSMFMYYIFITLIKKIARIHFRGGRLCRVERLTCFGWRVESLTPNTTHIYFCVCQRHQS